MEKEMRRLFYFTFLILLVSIPSCTQSVPLPFEEPAVEEASDKVPAAIFDGQTLSGWHKHMGMPEAYRGGKWEVVDGAIVGDQDPPGKGGFLITEGKYRDLVLSFEFMLDHPADSGIFLRVGEEGLSHQVTLDNDQVPLFGSIYLPWTQGMVHQNLEAAEHFKPKKWNSGKVRIEGEPARIQFWMNGLLLTDFQHTEETTKGVPTEGYIGLQVHAGEHWEKGSKVRFRNLILEEL
jgi:hypothetical protein